MGLQGRIEFIDETTICKSTGNGIVFEDVESGQQVRAVTHTRAGLRVLRVARLHSMHLAGWNGFLAVAPAADSLTPIAEPCLGPG